MEIPFKGWDRGFNVMVLRMCELVLPLGFDRGPDAPQTLDGLNAYVKQTGRIKISDQNADQSVFGSAEVNLASRAWHEWTHYAYQIPMTPEGERTAYEHQLVDMMKVYGTDATSLRWAQMLYADIVGQTEYAARHGVFPVNQMAFNLAYLVNPHEAVEMGLFHPIDLREPPITGAGQTLGLEGVSEERAAVIRHGIG